MNAHPDTAGRAASIIHRERIAAARQASLIRQAERLQPIQHRRLRQCAASMRRIISRGVSATHPAAAPAQRIGQAGSTPV